MLQAIPQASKPLGLRCLPLHGQFHRHGKPHGQGHRLRAAAEITLLRARQQRADGRLAAEEQATDAAGATEFVGGEGQRCDAERLELDRHAADRRHESSVCL